MYNNVYDLMPNQFRYLRNMYLDKNSTNLNMPIALEISCKEIGVEEIKAAFYKVLFLNPALQIILFHQGISIKQRFGGKEKISVPVYQGKKTNQDQYIKEFIKPFEIFDCRLVRAAIYVYSEAEYLFLFDSNHLIIDGISKNIFIKEFICLLDKKTITETSTGYDSFIAQYYQYLSSSDYKRQQTYWLRQIENFSIHENDGKRWNSCRDSGNTVHKICLSKEKYTNINVFAQYQQTTPYIVFFSALSYLLYYYQNVNSIVISSIFSLRQVKEANMMGQCTNILPIFYQPDKQLSFIQFVRAYRDKIVETFQYVQYPVFDLNNLQMSEYKNVSYSNLLKIILIYHHYEIKNNIFYLQNGKVTLIDVFQFSNPLGIEVNVYENICNEYEILINVNNTFYGKEEQKKLIKQYQSILENICEPFKLPVGEKKKINWAHYYKLQPVHIQFDHYAKAHPKQIAVIARNGRFSYAEIVQKSLKVAAFLKSKNIKKGDIVALVMDRSYEVLIYLLGAMRLGAIFAIINTEYSIERIKFMIKASKAKFVLTNNTNIKYAALFDEDDINAADNKTDYFVTAEDIAYIAFTSGSTNTPQGVFIKHGALANTFLGLSMRISTEKIWGAISISNISFDVFLVEVLWTLIYGIPVYISDSTEYKDDKQIISIIKKFNINMLQITPSILSLYLNQYPEIIERMKVLLVGGEIFTKTLAHQLFCHNSGRIYNLYGLTELAIWTTVKEIKRDNTISVGKPICNNKVYILNDYLQPQEPYTEGTVYISGFGVHANLLSGDNSRFIEIPELEERFLYNTNDIGFLDSHGELTIVGRKDNEIKFHGIRIQPAEIESVLEGISGVRGAVVALQGELREQVIVAYLVLDISIDLYQIQSYMRDKLPIEFIPSIYYKIDQIYLNKNGKRDMDKICEKAIRIITEGTEPLDKFEQEIVTIIKEKLGIEYTSVEDNIFFIGVTSILVIIIRNELEKVFDIKLDLINLYEHPTVKKLAVFIKTLISGRMENKDEK